MDILNLIKNYIPYNKEEIIDKEKMIKFIEENDDYLYRSNEEGHLTVSCFILNNKRDKVLMCYHRIYDSWAWCGGHSDGETNPLVTALKEAKEETGLKNISFIDENIFSLEILNVDEHMKKGKLVKKHLHYNITYVLEADENEKLKIKEDENSSLCWFSFNECLTKPSEKWMVEHIYKKLIKKVEENLCQK